MDDMKSTLYNQHRLYKKRLRNYKDYYSEQVTLDQMKQREKDRFSMTFVRLGDGQITVYWADGTMTYVQPKEPKDKDTLLAMAFAKKALNNEEKFNYYFGKLLGNVELKKGTEHTCSNCWFGDSGECMLCDGICVDHNMWAKDDKDDRDFYSSALKNGIGIRELYADLMEKYGR